MNKKIIKMTKEKVAKLSTEVKIKMFCELVKEIDLLQEDIDKDLKYGKED